MILYEISNMKLKTFNYISIIIMIVLKLFRINYIFTFTKYRNTL